MIVGDRSVIKDMTVTTRTQRAAEAQDSHDTLDGGNPVPASAGAQLQPLPTQQIASPLQALLQVFGGGRSSCTPVSSSEQPSSQPHFDAQGEGEAALVAVQDPAVPLETAVALESSDQGGRSELEPTSEHSHVAGNNNDDNVSEGGGNAREGDAVPDSESGSNTAPAEAGGLPSGETSLNNMEERLTHMQQQFAIQTSLMSQQFRQQQQDFAGILTAVMAENARLASTLEYEPFRQMSGSKNTRPSAKGADAGTNMASYRVEPASDNEVTPRLTSGTSTEGTRDANIALGSAFSTSIKEPTSSAPSRPSASSRPSEIDGHGTPCPRKRDGILGAHEDVPHGSRLPCAGTAGHDTSRSVHDDQPLEQPHACCSFVGHGAASGVREAEDHRHALQGNLLPISSKSRANLTGESLADFPETHTGRRFACGTHEDGPRHEESRLGTQAQPMSLALPQNEDYTDVEDDNEVFTEAPRRSYRSACSTQDGLQEGSTLAKKFSMGQSSELDLSGVISQFTAAILAGSGGKVKDKRTAWDLSWTNGSRHPALRGFDTKVDVAMGLRMAPRDKASMTSVHESLKPETLLKPFHDGLLQATYVQERVRLTTALYSLACTASSEDDADGLGFAVMVRALQRSAAGSKPVGGGTNSYTRLTQIEFRVRELSQGNTIKSEDGVVSGANTANLLHLFDCTFAAATRQAKYSHHERALAELSYENCVLPSVALTRMRHLICMKKGDEVDAWDETTGRFQSMLEAQVQSHPELQPFVSKMADKKFMDDVYEEWHDQFLIYEENNNFRTAFALLNSRDTQVSARSQGAPRTSDRNDIRLDRAIAALESAVPSSKAPHSFSGESSLSGLRAQVSAITASPSSGAPRWNSFAGFDNVWVQKEGVPGKPSPSSFDKWPLWTAKVCKALAIPMPNGMSEGDTKVGKDCPACAERGFIPNENWYYRTTDPDFNVNGSRERPKDKPRCAWMHRHTLCTQLWMRLHRHVKENPGDVHLFDRLPEGQDPSIL